MLKLFNSTDTLFSTNGDKVIIPLVASGSFTINHDASRNGTISASALKKWSV